METEARKDLVVDITTIPEGSMVMIRATDPSTLAGLFMDDGNFIQEAQRRKITMCIIPMDAKIETWNELQLKDIGLQRLS